MPNHTEIEEERAAALPEAHMVKEFRQYARGRQKGTLTASQNRTLRGLLGNLFCDNICKQVLIELSNRLTLARFEVAGSGTRTAEAQAKEQFLRDKVWTKNHMPKLAHFVHFSTFRDGDHAVATSWVDGGVLLTRERWWNGQTGIFVAYDDYGRPSYAVKDWEGAEGFRRVVWYPDRIERFIQSGTRGWRPYMLETDTQWPVPTYDRAGQPMGIPVVHFANLQVPNDADGDDDNDDTNPNYGMSELDGGVLGLQDSINSLHRDLDANALFAAYQMLYATGIDAQEDEQGTKLPRRVEPGAMFEEPNKDARFGTLPPGSPEALISTLVTKLQAVGRMTSVPIHSITGQWPSGDAIGKAERPLIDKIGAIARFTGPAWSSVAHLATKLANTYGGAGLNEDLLISAVYVSPERRELDAVADFLSKVGDRLSPEECLRQMNFSPEQIKRIMKEREEAAQRLSPIDSLNRDRAQLMLERDRRAGQQPDPEQAARERLAAAAQQQRAGSEQ